jgi:hypothetical protein
MQFIQMRSLLLALLLALTEAASASTTWYVNGMTGNNANNCLSANTACKTIRHAVSLAVSGDSILVAATTYKERVAIGFSLKITGTGGTPIIDGELINTVVTVSRPSAHVTLSRLSIRNGAVSTETAGGGILNIGTLTINAVQITGNHACGGAGIYNAGTLVINNTSITGNFANQIGLCSFGAGIGNNGMLTINRSTISGNHVNGRSGQMGNALGGGIFNRGHLRINNTTISGNVTGVGTGASLAAGGGIYTNGGTLAINNSTITENSADVGGNLYIFSSPVTVQNSIVANSLSGGNCHGAVASDGYNLSSDNTCSLDNTGDMNNTDPMLGLLQNNGGPTMTMALLPGSPAIDAGNPSGCTDGQGHLLKTDQRGKPRPDPEDTGGCDMGAYENQTD